MALDSAAASHSRTAPPVVAMGADIRQSGQEQPRATAQRRDVSETVLVKNAKGREEPVDVEMSVAVPERVRIQLSKVEPELFERLADVLGKDYFAPSAFEDHFTLKKPELLDALRPK